MLPEYRLKVQFVGSIKISRYSLWVTVDHYGFITTFSCCQYSVYTTIIELYTLTDSVWTGTKYNYFLFISDYTVIFHITRTIWLFNFSFKGRIIVWRYSFKLSCTSINQLIYPINIEFCSLIVYFTLITIYHMRDLSIGKSFLLCF